MTYPLTYVIDYLFGEILRGGPPCPDVVKTNLNISLEECLQNRRTPKVIYDRFALFLAPILLGFVWSFLQMLIPKGKRVFKLLSFVCGAFSALVFFPWFKSDFRRFIPTRIKLVVLVPMFVLWVLFPLVRSSATLMIEIYLSSFVIYWRVFKESVLGLGYDERRFNLLLGIATLMHWIAPFMVTAQQ